MVSIKLKFPNGKVITREVKDTTYKIRGTKLDNLRPITAFIKGDVNKEYVSKVVLPLMHPKKAIIILNGEVVYRAN